MKSHSAFFRVQCNKGLFLGQGYPHLKKDNAFCTKCCNYSAEQSVTWGISEEKVKVSCQCSELNEIHVGIVSTVLSLV